MRGVTLEPDTVRDFAAEHKIALGTSLDEVLADKSIEAVMLATPHTKHRAQVEAVAAAGKHIYCEKPFALSKADAQAALDACKRAGIVIGVGHHFRLMPSMRVLAELKESGAFGTIMHVEGNYSHDWLANYPADSWRMPAEESRAGGMTGMGIHVLDCFRDMVGPMKRISALSKARALQAADRRHHGGADRIRERRHRHARHHDEDAVPLAHRDLRRELLGRKRQRDARDRALRRQGEPEVIDRPADNHLGRNLDYFAKAVMGQGAFPISPAGILQTAAALEAVFKSADANGAWMTV